MEKSFDQWNEVKKKVDKKERPYFREGEIWWVNLGINIGVETNGKYQEFTRPALVLRKYQYSFLSAPLSASAKSNKYRIEIGLINGKKAIVNLSQLRNIDSKRLVRKIGRINKWLFDSLKKKAGELNFHQLSSQFAPLGYRVGEPEGQQYFHDTEPDDEKSRLKI